MEEPNLSVIKEISGNDKEFENSILDVIKTEFPQEVELFTKNYDAKDYIEAANNVHKIKHKIGLLGLENGVNTATQFENELKTGNTKLHQKFLDILDKIHVYLY